MNRRYTAEDLAGLIDRIRKKIPDIALRTTLLVGFPGETESDIMQLEEFLLQYRFDHVGIFAYSNEEGCASENFAGPCTEEEKKARREYLLQVQSNISLELQKKYIGRIEPVLIEGLSGESDLLLEGRMRFQAPDVDGCVYIVDGVANPGDIVNVNITEAHVYDLVGVIAEDGSFGPETGNV
jgi:ribosomal protein S12 methylthiotransferase